VTKSGKTTDEQRRSDEQVAEQQKYDASVFSKRILTWSLLAFLSSRLIPNISYL
jgi:hypothetical protein